MNTCRSCGSTFSGNFCSNCGAPANAPLRCPRCNNQAAPNTAFCAYCGAPLTPPQGQGFQPPYQPTPQPQQNNAGKYIMGALGGAAAVIGGEMLLHDIERGGERHEWEGHHHHHHHHRRCSCGHEFGIDIDICPRCRRHWRPW